MTTAPPPTAYEPPQEPAGGFSLGDFLSFTYLITPALVQGIYILGAILITIAGLFAMLSSGPNSGPLVGILIIVFGNLVWRVYMELMMLFFRINQGIQQIERNSRH
ncbi:MAG: DUF4282 domain-containing protein [Candidatus Limnocylindria bacterium]